MPRVARFRISAVGELYRQLRYAPRETLARQMRAAEELIDLIEPQRTYPQDFVVWRITGYRPDAGDEPPATLVGAALAGDLASFVQRLSDALELPSDWGGRRAVPIEEVAERLEVSSKTIQRYRRQGLVCHYVVFGDGAKRLACFDDALEQFRRRHAKRVERAARFSRVPPDVEAEMVEAAAALRREQQATLNEAALVVARRWGRAHETVRGILKRRDRSSEAPLFIEPGPLGDRDARLILRAWRRGIPVPEVARRLARHPATVRRALHRERALVLEGLDLGAVELPTFERDEAESVILAAPAVVTRLDEIPAVEDAVALIDASLPPHPIDEDLEAALVAGYNLLKRRARREIAALPPWPGTARVDRIEADLRWAMRLKRRLAALGFPHALAALEQSLQRRLRGEPSLTIESGVRFAVEVSSAVVERLDPARGQRLGRLAAQAMDRALAGPRPGGLQQQERHGRPQLADPLRRDRAGRATARHESQSVAVNGLFEGLVSWEEALELRRDLRGGVVRLEVRARALVELLYGLGPSPPLALAAAAARLGLTANAAARLHLAALRDLRRLPSERPRATP